MGLPMMPRPIKPIKESLIACPSSLWTAKTFIAPLVRLPGWQLTGARLMSPGAQDLFPRIRELDVRMKDDLSLERHRALFGLFADFRGRAELSNTSMF